MSRSPERPIPDPPEAGFSRGERAQKMIPDPLALRATMEGGKSAQRMLALLADHLAAEEKRVIERAISAVDTQDGIAPRLAVQLWVELAAIRRFPRGLRKQIDAGLDAAEKLSQQGLA